jgi:hypothetical protein
VICFFTLKGLKARVIHAEHESIYGPEARPAVKKWQTRFHQRETDLFDNLRFGSPSMNDLAGAVGSMLEERVFSSYMVLFRHFRVGMAPCLRILHDKLGLKNSIFIGCCMHCRSTRRAKTSYSKLFLTPLIEQKTSGFQRITTEYESWLFPSYSCDSVWAASRDQLPQRIKQKIDAEKCLMSILGWLTESTVFLSCPKGQPTTQRSSLILLYPV